MEINTIADAVKSGGAQRNGARMHVLKNRDMKLDEATEQTLDIIEWYYINLEVNLDINRSMWRSVLDIYVEFVYPIVTISVEKTKVRMHTSYHKDDVVMDIGHPNFFQIVTERTVEAAAVVRKGLVL